MGEGKVCNKCEQFKPLNSFYKNSKGAKGRGQTCNVCSQEYARAYRESNSSKIFAKKFSISEDEVDRLYEITSCEICGGGGRLVIDHCHATGQVRGRICSVCNSGLGLLGDTLESVGKALSYLERFNRG